MNTLYRLCAFSMRICILGEDVHSKRSKAPFPVRHILIPGEDESQRNKRPHWEWQCESPEMHMYAGNGNEPHREW